MMFIMVMLMTGPDTLYREKCTLLHIVLWLVMGPLVRYIILSFVYTGLLLQRGVFASIDGSVGSMVLSWY